MNIASDTRERIGTTSISESLHNTYNFSQESGKTVKAVRKGLSIKELGFTKVANYLLIS